MYQVKAAILAIPFLGLIASPAVAFAGPSGSGGGASEVVQYDVKLTIPPRCGWAPGGQPAATMDLGSLDVSGSKDIPFALDCNAPFVIRAASLNGALRHGGTAPTNMPPSAFTDVVPYDVDLSLGVRQADGSINIRQRQCSATALLAISPAGSCEFAGTAVGQGWSSNNAVANAADASLPHSGLRLSWSANQTGSAARLAGSYSDVLTVSVEAQS